MFGEGSHIYPIIFNGCRFRMPDVKERNARKEYLCPTIGAQLHLENLLRSW
jgi:hypothetical protein